MHENEIKPKKRHTLLIILLLLVLVAAIGAGLWYAKENFNKTANPTNNEATPTSEPSPEPVKEPEIFNGDARPIAVMIDNVGKPAWPHVGLGDAYCVYEIIVEGGISRLMALYKGADTAEIGPVRSARPYFIDYVLENDAVYAHFGHTIMAKDHINSENIDDIDGLYLEGTVFWREKSTRNAPHNAMTSMERINNYIASKNIRSTSTDKGFNYVVDDYDLTSETVANKLKIVYSNYHYTSYEYDAETKLYKRSMQGTPHVDAITKEQYTAKNIVITFIENSMLNDTRDIPDKGYQKLANIGTGKGYFVTNGKYEEITWSKSSRSAKTQYLDLEGNEVEFNDGVTYIQIVPINQKVTFE